VKKEWDRAPGFPALSFDGERSQFVPAALGAILRGADKHFDEVVVQRIVELALEAPFELRMVEVAGMEIEVISVHGDGCVFESDYEFDPLAFCVSGEIQQWVFVETELGEDSIQARGSSFGHTGIVKQRDGLSCEGPPGLALGAGSSTPGLLRFTRAVTTLRMTMPIAFYS
jgi:hypothetical protein